MAPPASNKPHPAERSTPVWLAIWHTWAGFANSQLRHALFPASINIYASIPIAATYGRCSDRRKSFGPSAPIAYATSASPPNEAAAWPVRSCRMGDKAVAWPVCRCWVPDTTATWLGVPFLQFIAHTNPSSRQLQGTLACAMICRKATFTISFSEVMLPDANFLSSRAQNRVFW